MKFSTVIVSSIAFVGLAAAQNTTTSSTSRTSNGAVPLYAPDKAVGYGLGGAIVAGALAYLI